MNKWISKMWYIHIIQYYSALKREEILTYYNMDKLWRHSNTWNKPVTHTRKKPPKTNTARLHSHEVPRATKFTETGSRVVLARGVGRECLMETASVFQDEGALEVDGGEGCTIWIYLMLLNCTLKMASVINFMLFILSWLKQLKKNKQKTQVIL